MNSMFVTEADVEEEKKRKQEDWLKIRRPDQPLLAPEQEVDHRSLYERLKEQKDKKDSELEEAHKFKNQFRGLESEEVDFINAVDEQKEEIERQKKAEEDELIKEFRDSNSRVLRAPSLLDKLGLSSKPLVSNKKKRPAGEAQGTSKKAKVITKSEPSQEHSSSSSGSDTKPTTISMNNNDTKDIDTVTNTTSTNNTHNNDTIRVLGVLPSLVEYFASDESQSDSDTSASSSDDLTFGTASILRRPAKTCKQA